MPDIAEANISISLERRKKRTEKSRILLNPSRSSKTMSLVETTLVLAEAERSISAVVALEIPALAPNESKFSLAGSLGIIRSVAGNKKMKIGNIAFEKSVGALFFVGKAVRKNFCFSNIAAVIGISPRGIWNQVRARQIL